MQIRTLLTVLCLLALATFAPGFHGQGESHASAQEPSDFSHLVDQYFDFYFQFHPTEATAAGFHQYDGKLEDFSQEARDAEISGLKEYLGKFQAVSPALLPEVSAGDLAFLVSNIQARLLALQQIQMRRKDPDRYTSIFSYSVFLVMRRNFAPAEERLRSVIARENAAPQLFAAARHNLENPPRIYTQVALQQLPGTIGFFRDDVPAAFSSVKDADLLAQFKESNRTALASLEKYQDFLEHDLLPVSHGDFRIGAENFRKKLLYEEMVDIPLDHLLEIGYADLHRNQQRLKETAAEIDGKRSPREVLASLQKDHPAPDQLLPAFREVLGGLKQFIEEHKIITIPSEIPPIVEETPPFQRALTTASMDTPGPYESKATEAMFNVTLPDPSWKPQKIEQWMEGFNRGTIISTAIHEVYPGHYTQFLWAKRMPSKTRKLLYCNTNAEGWAHYTEQMMLDEGYGNGDPRLRLGQVDDALLRDARFIAGIQMHTGKMTLDEAAKFFIQEGYQVPPVAEEEAQRGTSDPTYLYYTLGKLQILKLRTDYEKMQGNKFSLLEFHDRFMEQGGLPLKLIRKAMLGDDSPTL